MLMSYSDHKPWHMAHMEDGLGVCEASRNPSVMYRLHQSPQINPLFYIHYFMGIMSIEKNLVAKAGANR